MTPSVDLGTIAAYEISPVMMDLYGLEKPLWFEKLARRAACAARHARAVSR